MSDKDEYEKYQRSRRRAEMIMRIVFPLQIVSSILLAIVAVYHLLKLAEIL